MRVSGGIGGSIVVVVVWCCELEVGRRLEDSSGEAFRWAGVLGWSLGCLLIRCDRSPLVVELELKIHIF